MKHGKGIIITTVIIVVICFVAVPLGVNYAFRQEAPVDIFAARWMQRMPLTILQHR